MNTEPRALRHRSDPLFRSIVGTFLLLGVAFLSSFLYWGSGPIIGDTPWYVPTMHGFTGLAAFIVAFLSLGRHRLIKDPASY